MQNAVHKHMLTSVFYFIEISSVSTLHLWNSVFHFAEMSSISALDSPPLPVILSFSFGSNSCLWLTSDWEMKPGFKAWRGPPADALSPPRKNNKNQSGAVSYRTSLSFPPHVFHLLVLSFFLFVSLPLSLEGAQPGEKPPHLCVQPVCVRLCVCMCAHFLEPGAGSSCVQRGQYTPWQSVIIPEGGVGGLHNAGWHPAKFKAA